MRLEILKRFAAVGLVAMAVLLALPTDRHLLGQPHYQATVSGDEEATLVHTKTPTKMTVCADRHNEDHATISYDENHINLGPGHCALVDGSYVKARSAGDSSAHVYGWHHPHHHDDQ
jgi:hypothetical protein